MRLAHGQRLKKTMNTKTGNIYQKRAIIMKEGQYLPKKDNDHQKRATNT